MAKKKRKITAATRERLRKMRQKYGLGEYKKYGRSKFDVMRDELRRARRIRKRKSKKSLKATSHTVNSMSRRRRRARVVYRSPRKARRRRSSRKGMFGLGGLGQLISMDTVLMGAGAGVAGLAGSKINELTKGTLSGNVAQGGAGIGIYLIGKQFGMSKYTTPLAKGILIKTIGDLVEDNVVPKLSGMVGTSTSTSSSATVIG